MMIAYRVEWNNSTRKCNGVVVSEVQTSEGNYAYEVYSDEDDEVYSLTSHINSKYITKVKTDIEGYLKYRFKTAGPSMKLDEFVECLTDVKSKDIVMQHMIDIIKGNLNNIYDMLRKSLLDDYDTDSKLNITKSRRSDAKDEEKSSEDEKDDNDDDSDEGEEGDDENEDDDEEDDEDDDDDEEDDEDEDDDDDEETEHTNEEYEESDVMTSSYETFETSDSYTMTYDSESAERKSSGALSPQSVVSHASTNRHSKKTTRKKSRSESFPYVVNVKVVIQSVSSPAAATSVCSETRGFPILNVKQGHKYIVDTLTKDYNLLRPPILTYKDPDGDTISIKGQNDFMYALQTHQELELLKSEPKASSGVTDADTAGGVINNVKERLQNKINSTGNNKRNITIKLYASIENQIPTSATATALTPLAESKTSPRNDARLEQQSDYYKQSSSHIATDFKQSPRPGNTHMSTVSSSAVTGTAGKRSNTSTSSTVAAAVAPQNYIQNRKIASLLWQRGEVIGAGSFGQVFSGIDLKTGNKLAVKEVCLALTGLNSKKQKRQAKALRQEIKILSKLDHPNIIKYYGTEIIEDFTMRIFLEFATEGSVKDVLTQYGPLSELIVRRYVVDILSGLNYLHSRGVIHRDIKPTNLLVSNGIVKLADFGCSSMNFDAGHTTEGHDTVAGTTVYMSPEVMRAEGVNMESTPSSPAAGATRNAAAAAAPTDKEETHARAEVSLDGSPRSAAAALWNHFSKPFTTAKTKHSVVPQSNPVASSSASAAMKETANDAKSSARDKNDSNNRGLFISILGRSATTESLTAMTPRTEAVDSLEKMFSPQPPITRKKSKRALLSGSTNGYGRKADLWSLGITLVELSTAKSPFRSAASAIYAVCVTKQFPTFPRHFSSAASLFLDRCLQENPKDRADCAELLLHSFVRNLSLQSPMHAVQNDADIDDVNDTSAAALLLRQTKSSLLFSPPNDSKISDDDDDDDDEDEDNENGVNDSILSRFRAMDLNNTMSERMAPLTATASGKFTRNDSSFTTSRRDIQSKDSKSSRRNNDHDDNLNDSKLQNDEVSSSSSSRRLSQAQDAALNRSNASIAAAKINVNRSFRSVADSSFDRPSTAPAATSGASFSSKTPAMAHTVAIKPSNNEKKSEYKSVATTTAGGAQVNRSMNVSRIEKSVIHDPNDDSINFNDYFR